MYLSDAFKLSIYSPVDLERPSKDMVMVIFPSVTVKSLIVQFFKGFVL